MSASVMVNFAGGSATSPDVELVLTDCELTLGANAGVTVAMASALTNITITGTQIAISTAVGGQFNGSVAIQVSWGSGRTPSLTLNNLHGAGSPATVTWPTSIGPQTQILGPGFPMSLVGIVDG